tara:strand:- start:49 stop:1434 length:1386 start_codon:yes stop_codon:yes gene_type:complete
MATLTFTWIRRHLAAYLGYSDQVGLNGTAWTTTTNIGAGTTVISTELRDAGFDDLGDAGSGDNLLQGWWIWLLGTNNSQVERLVKSYDASAGELTVAGTSLSSESGATDFELHRWRPSLLRFLLNIASTRAFPLLYLPVTRSLFTAQNQVRYEVPSVIIGQPTAIWLEQGLTEAFANSILTDGGFEAWTNSTTLTNWTATTLDTTQEEATTTPINYAVLRDASSTRCTSQTGSRGDLLQSISSPGTHSGQRISLSVWVYCLTASVVSTAIKIGGTFNLGTAADGGLHTGSGWELLTQYEDSTVTISSLDVGISIVSTAADNTEFYVDEAICVVGPLQEPEVLGRELRNWRYVPQVQSTTLRSEVVFPYGFPDNYRLRFEGRGYLSSFSAETDTIEIGRPQTDLLNAYVAAELYHRLSQPAASADWQFYRAQEDNARRDIERLKVHAVRGQGRKLMIPDWGT